MHCQRSSLDGRSREVFGKAAGGLIEGMDVRCGDEAWACSSGVASVSLGRELSIAALRGQLRISRSGLASRSSVGLHLYSFFAEDHIARPRKIHTSR